MKNIDQMLDSLEGSNTLFYIFTYISFYIINLIIKYNIVYI